MTSKSDMVLRPTSEQLCELHVYVVPPSLWQQHLNSAINQVIEETVSAGFVRVHPELNVYSLREEIESQLGFDTVPGDYYFLKCIGRCFTRVKPKQEYQIKVKNFLPPIAYSPEIYLLESTAEIRALFPPSGTSSERSGTASQRNSSVHHHHPNHYQSPHHTHTAHHRRSSTGGSDVNPHRPIPPIRDGATRSSSLRDLATQTDHVPSQRVTSSLRHHRDRSASTHAHHQRHHTHNASGVHVPPINVTSPSSAGDHPLHADSSRTLHTTSSPHLTSGAGADRLPNGEGEGDDAAVEDGYLPPLSATPPQSPPPAHKPPATPHTYRAADRGGGGEEDEALKRRQLEELKRERDEIDKLSEEIQQKRYIDDQVERKKKELEEIERAQKLTDENNKLTEREKERITAENERQKAEIERQYAEKIRTDEENRRRNEMDEYRRELERELIRRQEERERQRDDLKREQEELERKKQEEEERRKAEKRAEEERTYRELQQQIEDLKRQQQLQQQQSAREDVEKIRQSSSSNADDSDNTPGSPKKATLTYREKGQDVENEEATAVDHTQDNEEEQHGDNEATEHEEPVDKEALIERLEQVRAERKEAELRREDLVKRAKQLQNKAQNRRNQARDVWKKKYFEEKKKTPPLEKQSAKLKQELDAQHRKIMSNLEGGRETHRAVDSSKPGPKTNLRIQSTKLEHDIESLKRRLENVKMKLTTEMKLRSQAETELRALRAELTQKKINLTLSRSQQLQVLGGAGGGHPQQDTTRTPIPMYQ